MIINVCVRVCEREVVYILEDICIMKIYTYKWIPLSFPLSLYFFFSTTCESTCGTLSSSAAN